MTTTYLRYRDTTGFFARTVTALAVTLLLVAGIFTEALADERDDQAAKKAGAEEKIAELRGELEGLDADLADVFVELQQVEGDLGVAQAELDVAQDELAKAEQELAVATDQLDVAEVTAAKLTAELEHSASEEETLSFAVGSMARDLYRGGPQTPLTLVLGGEKTADINERAASATTMSRAQARALEEVRSSMASIRNQSERQAATTARVAELKAVAEGKQAEAETAAANVQEKVDGLESLQSELKTRQQAWDARKTEAKQQLNSWQESRDAAAAKIAQIDEENRKKQIKFEEEAAEKRAREQAAAPSKPAPAAPAPAAPASPSGGGMFGYPLAGGRAHVTSHYGWRIHPIFGTRRLHDGTDFSSACGSPQYAIRAGVVQSAYFDSGGGNMATINHGMVSGSSWVSQHLHLQSFAVSPGQQVSRGDLIGYTGTTGNSTGCHLHLTLYKNGSTVNPLDYL